MYFKRTGRFSVIFFILMLSLDFFGRFFYCCVLFDSPFFDTIWNKNSRSKYRMHFDAGRFSVEHNFDGMFGKHFFWSFSKEVFSLFIYINSLVLLMFQCIFVCARKLFDVSLRHQSNFSCISLASIESN